MNERKQILAIALFTVCIVGALMVGRPGASLAQGPSPQVAGPQTMVAPVLQYQGRILLNSGSPITDGAHTAVLKLYTDPAAPSAIWTETKPIQTVGGLFSTRLGDPTPLDPAFFNGQALWLGINVDGDGEAIPRQEFLAVPYALSLMPGALISGTASPATLQVRNLGAGDALRVDGNLNVSGNLVGGTHNHDAAYYTKSQAESLYVNTAGGDAINGTGAANALAVTQIGTGVGISATASGNIGLRGATGLTTNEMAGVLGVAGWTNTMLNNYAGVLGKSANGLGVAGLSDNNAGVMGTSGTAYGVYGVSGSNSGVYGSAGGAQPGIIGRNNGTGVGVVGTSSATHGVQGQGGSGAGDYGGYFTGYGGVYGQGTSYGATFTSTNGYGVYSTAGSSLPALYAENVDGGASIQGYKSSGAAGAAVQGYTYGTGRGVEAYSAGGWSAYVWGGGSGALYAGGNSTVAGTLTTQKVAYSSPRPHYWSVAGEGFQPTNSGSVYNNYGGMGGACVSTGSNLVAPVNLPHGAIVTSFTGKYNANAGVPVTLELDRLSLGGSAYAGMASVSSGVLSGYVSVSDSSIGYATIDNINYGYFINAWWGTGNCNTKVMGAVIAYTISEAE
jgi:hypothetical protein